MTTIDQRIKEIKKRYLKEFSWDDIAWLLDQLEKRRKAMGVARRILSWECKPEFKEDAFEQIDEALKETE